MKRIGTTLSFLLLILISLTSFSYGYSMNEYWAIKEGHIGIYDRDLIVHGLETRSFGPYTGREYLMAIGYSDSQPFVYVGAEGLLFVGLLDKESSSYIDLSAYPIVISESQMNLGDTVTSTVPAGILETTEMSFTVTLLSQEDVTVPAGIFVDCLKLQFEIHGDGGVYIEHVWLAKGVGVVQMYRVSETTNNSGCFFTCGSVDYCSDQIIERYTKLKGYVRGGKGVVVLPF